MWPSLWADFLAWIVPLRGRPREMVAPLASALASPKDGAPVPSILDAWRRALEAGRALYLAVPPLGPSKAIKELLRAAWQQRPARPQRVWPQWPQWVAGLGSPEAGTTLELLVQPVTAGAIMGAFAVATLGAILVGSLRAARGEAYWVLQALGVL